MDDDRRGLVAVLLDARALLARPENDFGWSSWADAEAALREIDGLVDRVRAGGPLDGRALSVLFAPTGPIQEVSLSSGWASEFLDLSAAFDRACERLGR